MGGRTRALMAALGLVGIVAAAALGPPAAGAAGGEVSVIVKGGEQPVEIGFGFSPKLPPAGEGGVTRLELDLHEAEIYGGLPPGIDMTTIGLDRSIEFEPRGLPVCWKPGVEGGIQVQAASPDECDRAVVGYIEANVLVDFPETMPVNVLGKGKVYNAGARGGGTNLLLEIPLSNPFNGVLWLVARVRPLREGRFRSRLTIRVPELAGGDGFLTKLRLRLGRNFGRNGERVGYVQARCDGGKLTASQSTRLTEGTEGHSESVRACSGVAS